MILTRIVQEGDVGDTDSNQHRDDVGDSEDYGVNETKEEHKE